MSKILLLFLLTFINLISNGQSKIMKLKIDFLDTGIVLNMSIIPKNDIPNYLFDSKAIKDEKLCQKFGSEIFILKTGEILETKPGWVYAKVYQNTNELLLSRRVGFYLQSNDSCYFVVKYSVDQLRKILENYQITPIDGLVEDNRRGYMLSNGKVIVLSGKPDRVSGARIYNSLFELNITNPFGIDEEEEEEE